MAATVAGCHSFLNPGEHFNFYELEVRESYTLKDETKSPEYGSNLSGVSLNVGTPPFEGPLAASSRYYLTEDHTTSARKELLMQLFLMAVCISGAYLYWGPSSDYAKRVGQQNIASLYIGSVCFTALATLYVATDIFFKLHASTNIPPELEGKLKNPQTRAQRWAENGFITFVSALSAVVLASIFFRFPPPDWATWGVGVMAAVIFIDNTILHFLPVKLMLTQKIWRAPFLPFEMLAKFIYTKIRDCNMTPRDHAARAFETIKAGDLMALKMAIVQRLELAKNKLMRDSFRWIREDLHYVVRPHEVLKNLATSETPLLDILRHAEDPGFYFQIPPAINGILGLISVTAGAIWIWACAAGYYAAPFNQFTVWTGSDAAAAGITALPIYTMMVLLGFFGELFVGQAYGYLTTWGSNVTKISPEIKLWPKTFGFFMLVNGAMAGFSYAAGAELIHTQITYDWAQRFVPFLLGCAYSGLAYAGFMSVRGFTELMFAKLGQHVVGDNTGELFKANEKIDQMKNAVKLMDHDQLETELSRMSVDERKIILGMDDGQYKATIDHQGKFKAQQEVEREKAENPSFLMRFFCCVKPKSEPLLGGHDKTTSGPIYTRSNV